MHKKSGTILKALLLSIGSLSGNLLCASADNSVSKEEPDVSYHSDQKEKNNEKKGEEVTVEEPFGQVVYTVCSDGTIEAPAEVHDYVTSKRHWRELSVYGKRITFDDLSEKSQTAVVKRYIKKLRETGDVRVLRALSVEGCEMVCAGLAPTELPYFFKKAVKEGPAWVHANETEVFVGDFLHFWRAMNDDQKGECFPEVPSKMRRRLWGDMTPEWQGRNFQYYPQYMLVDHDYDKKEMTIDCEVWRNMAEKSKTKENLAFAPPAFQAYVIKMNDVH